MKTDRELLELAARAAGYASWDFLAGEDGNLMNVYMDDGTHNVWWPLEDDGEALRLAVKLGMTVDVMPTCTLCESVDARYEHAVQHVDDPYEATRRAIVRAAAAIGESMT